jgi:hypothetical protein
MGGGVLPKPRLDLELDFGLEVGFMAGLPRSGQWSASGSIGAEACSKIPRMV